MRHTLFAVLALTGALHATAAQAQWQWKDDNGSMVYSDRPPSAHIKASQIIKQPLQPKFKVPPAGDPADADKAKAPETAKKDAPKTTAELDADFKKRRTEQADADKKQREAQDQKRDQSENCEKMRGYLRTLESGVRVAETDANGEKVYLDDAQRQAEVERTKKALAACH